MAASNSKEVAKLIRSTLREVKNSSLNTTKFPGGQPMAKFILDKAKNSSMTAENLCVAENMPVKILDTYNCYLKYSKLNLELYEKYKGRQRDVEETANLVGLTTNFKNDAN